MNSKIIALRISGKKLGSFSTGLVQKEKSQIDIGEYINSNNGMLLFEVVGNTKKETLKVTF